MSDPFQLVGVVLAERYRVDAWSEQRARERGPVLRYLAFDQQAQLPVSLLVLVPAAQGHHDTQAFTRALDRVVALSALHPGLVRIVAHGTLPAPNEAPYLVLERAQGTTLGAAIAFEREAGRRARVEHVLLVLEPVIRALGAAHSEGLAHGDLEPENIQLVDEPEGQQRAKLHGLGLATLVAALGGRLAPSPRFAAPEQWEPRLGALRPQSDVYALALSCIEMLAEQDDTVGVEDAAAARARALDPIRRPSPAQRGVRLSESEEEVFRHALALQPEQRYGDVQRFWAALGAAASAKGAAPVSAPPQRGPARQGRIALWIALALAPLAVIALIVFLTSDAPSKRRSHGRDLEDDDAPVRRRTPSATVSSSLSRLPPPPPVVATPAPLPPLIQVPAPAPIDGVGCVLGMVRIPGGTFAMGSTIEPDEGPVHDVTVADLCLDRTEVTVDAYAACVTAGVCNDISLKEYSIEGSGGFSEHCNWAQPGRGNHPINCVSWNQANDYCRFRAKRLPTEEEWEYAARGGDQNRKYPWGSDSPGAQLCWNGPGNDAGESRRSGTCAVGSYPSGASRWGVEDLAGNVWEWTSSNYCPYTLAGRQSCGASARVARGGCWSCYLPIDGRAADRLIDQPSDRFDALGFRCATTPYGP